MVGLRKNDISQEFGLDGLLVISKQDKQTAAVLCRHLEKWLPSRLSKITCKAGLSPESGSVHEG